MSKITETIKKLLAKAESCAEIGSVLEAETFAKKANEMLIQHRLKQSDLDGPKYVKCAPFSLRGRKGGLGWIKSLCGTVGEHNGVISVELNHYDPKTQKIGKRIEYWGNPDAVEVSEYMFHVLATTFNNLAIKLFAKEVDKVALQKSYLIGCVRGLARKFDEQKKETERLTLQQSGESGLIHLRTVTTVPKADIMAFFDVAKFGRPTKVKTDISNAEAYNKGLQDGYNTNLSKGIKTNAPATLMLN